MDGMQGESQPKRYRRQTKRKSAKRERKKKRKENRKRKKGRKKKKNNSSAIFEFTRFKMEKEEFKFYFLELHLARREVNQAQIWHVFFSSKKSRDKSKMGRAINVDCRCKQA